MKHFLWSVAAWIFANASIAIPYHGTAGFNKLYLVRIAVGRHQLRDSRREV